MCPGLSDIYNRVMTSEKQPSSTANSRGSMHWRPDSLQMTASGNKTACSFGRERNQMNQDCMAWVLQWETLLSAVEPPSSGTAFILSLCISTSLDPVNFLRFYAPTLCSPAKNKDEFCEKLESSIREITATEHLYLPGDFNAQVGANHASWPSCIGHFSTGKLNRNGQRLLQLCSYHNLCITNTFFATKLSHRVSWWHPRCHHWHELDLIITWRPLLNCILITHSYHSADCDTNYSLVGSKMHLQPKQIHWSKQKGLLCINTARMSMPDLPWNFPPQHWWEGLCPCGAEQVAGAYWAHLPRGAVQIQGWKIDNWHDLLTTSAPREVPWAETTSLHCVYQCDQGFWLGQQKRPLYYTTEDWMSP